MNRLGRGYSFEAIRAKILFAEGAHKRTQSRPKFERKGRQQVTREYAGDGVEDELPAGAVGYAKFSRAPSKKPDLRPSPDSESTDLRNSEKNFGPDISTLTRMIANGEL